MQVSTGSKGFQSLAGKSTREERILSYTSIPVPHWFYHENSLWHAYSDVISNTLEDTHKGHTHIITIDDYSFDLAKMTSFKKGASKQKQLRRGTWFYKQIGVILPYEAAVSAVLESVWQKGEFKQPVLITPDPKRYVEFKNGVFTQFKPNKPQANKEVLRGWNGQVLETVTETTSIITTVTRDAIITGPGSAPYSKTLQPGVPFHTQLQNPSMNRSNSDAQYVPLQVGSTGNLPTIPQTYSNGAMYYPMPPGQGDGYPPQQVQMMMAPPGY